MRTVPLVIPSLGVVKCTLVGVVTLSTQNVATLGFAARAATEDPVVQSPASKTPSK